MLDATHTNTPPPAANQTAVPQLRTRFIEPAILRQIQRAWRQDCAPNNDAVCLGVTQKKVDLLVFDLDDTLMKLYGPVAQLNLKYLKAITAANDLSLYEIAKRTTTLSLKNPDAVVHDPAQLVRVVFGQAIAESPATQRMMAAWQEEKRAAFTAGIDPHLAETFQHFKKGGSKIAILSNSPQTPLRERLFLIDQALQQQGLRLLDLVDRIVCKPDPSGLTQRASLSPAEHLFQKRLDSSGKFDLLSKEKNKAQGILEIKNQLERQGSPLTHIIQIGDRPSDLQTAHQAGAAAVWIVDKVLGGEKIAMRMVGERNIAADTTDLFRQMMAPALCRRAPCTRPNAIIGNLNYLQRLFSPARPQ